MHERGLVSDVVREAESICISEPARPIRIRLTVGALAGLSAGTIDHYFRQLVEEDSPLEGIELEVAVSDDLDPVRAMSLSIDSLVFEDS